MDLSDARHNINSLVVSGGNVQYNEEFWGLFRESWRLIQEELNSIPKIRNQQRQLREAKERLEEKKFWRENPEQMGR